jgi:glucose/mannose-6-phosphate isomerase
MLDDLKYIHDRDAQDALGVAEKQWQQLERVFEVTKWSMVNGKYENIVLAGMGGSALAALISTSWPGYDVPFEICKNYDIPSYVGPGTFFIASSYSGNTEETLEAFGKAGKKGAYLAAITAGGKLADVAREANIPLLLLLSGMQPRMATLSNFKALLTMFDATGMTSGSADELTSRAQTIKQAVQAWLPAVPTDKNYAKQLALGVMGKSPVVYAGPKLFPVAYRWKISFNESAKNIAWCNQYPEFNHNEFVGWTSHPTEKPYEIIDLVSSFEHERIKKRFEVSDRLLSGKRPAATVVNAEGNDLLDQLLWTVVLGDFVSIYLAILNGLNPTPVDLIEKLKKSLAE